MNTEMTNRTWLAHDKIFIGPSFVLEDGRLEFPPEGGKATVYGASGKSELTQAAATVPDPPALANWSWHDAAPGAQCRTLIPAEVAFLCRPAADGNLRQLPEPLRLVLRHVARGQGRPGHTALRWAVRDVRSVPERPARHDDHIELRTVRHPHRSRTPSRATTPWPSWSRRHPEPKTRSENLSECGRRAACGAASPRRRRLVRSMSVGKNGRRVIAGADAAALAKPGYDDSTWTVVDPSAAATTIRGDSWYRGTFNVTPDQVDAMMKTPLFDPPPAPKGKRWWESTRGHRLSQRPVAIGPHRGRLQAPRRRQEHRAHRRSQPPGW